MRSGSPEFSEGHRLDVALVNNMPDAALVDTEEQFTGVLERADFPAAVSLRLYTIPGLERSDEALAVIRSRYQPIEELFADPPDALIVTGTEPSQTSLPYEPYWPQLAHLLQWAAATVPATMLSCLASHASVLLFDGIERVPLATKRHGIFPCEIPDRDSPLARRLPPEPLMPHSRINDVPAAAMQAAGYEIVATDATDSWSVATRRYGGRLFVLCQGHPEYGRESLLREYRRDVRRALLAPDTWPYPSVPHGYLDAESIAELQAFAQRSAVPGIDASAVWATFPLQQVAARIERSWAVTTDALYSAWLAEAVALTAELSDA